MEVRSRGSQNDGMRGARGALLASNFELLTSQRRRAFLDVGAAVACYPNSSGNSLHTRQQVGEEAECEFDSSGVTVNSTTSVVNLDTGLTVDLPATSCGPVGI